MKLLSLAAAALVVAGCQPQARRVLLLDLTLSDPLLLESTAAPWDAAGYRVEYRRFYPHLTRGDLARYRTVIVLGGREPEALSDALTIGDLAILAEWIRRDGVVVLGYSEGTLDRWILNRWLASQGAGIAIGAEALEVRGVPLPRSALDNAGFAPFQAGRTNVLLVRDQSQTLARALLPSAPSDRPSIVAGSRLRDGLILVASRNVLAASGADARTRDFLAALARWTMRPAEWAAIAPASGTEPLYLAGGPASVTVHPPLLAPPAGAAPVVLPQPRPPRPGGDEQPAMPGWIARQGMRVLWSRFSLYGADAILRFADAAALNALATAIPVSALADTLGNRNIWRVTAERLQTTSLRWFPAVALSELPSEGADEVDRHGDLKPIACGLDSLFWRGGVRPVYRALARLGGARPDLIAGVALDLDSAMRYYRGTGFCDGDYRVGVAALGLDTSETRRLITLPPALRYDTLLERGLLAPYFRKLQDAVAERATTLRAELRRLHPDLRFAVRASELPADWFSLGLMRGFSTREAPVLLWLRERRGRELRHVYRERGIFALSAIALEPARVSTAEWGRLRPLVFGEHDGFWLDGLATDSVGRLIRRLPR